MILVPSLLSADLGNLKHEILLLKEAGITWVHWDIMDGIYVPNITFGFPVMRAVRSVAPKMCFDTHLMIQEPERYVEQFCEAGANTFVFHPEVTKHPQRLVVQVRECGMLCGIALNPHVPIENVDYLLEYVDMVLLMSVNPGFSGQSFITNVLRKLEKLVAIRSQYGLQFTIQMDGGITPNNVATIIDAGVDVVVSGSSFFCVEKSVESYRKQKILFENAMKNAGVR